MIDEETLGSVGFGKKPVPEAMSMSEILKLGERYEAPQDRALLYFCYLTGCRITEALEARVEDIQRTRHVRLGEMATVKLITLKNRRVPFRIVPVLMKEIEEPMVSYIYSYIEVEGRSGKEKIFAWLQRTNAWNRMSKRKIMVRAIDKSRKQIIPEFVKKVNPHYLRHCRLTHLVQHYSFNEIQLMRFAGWTNTKPAIVYVHLDWMDLAKVMSQAGGDSWY